MNDRDEKLQLVREVIDFVVEQPYDPEVLAKFVYLKSLDARVYRYGDTRLTEIFDVLGGMSAGEEFFYSREEVLEMLNSFISDNGSFLLGEDISFEALDGTGVLVRKVPRAMDFRFFLCKRRDLHVRGRRPPSSASRTMTFPPTRTPEAGADGDLRESGDHAGPRLMGGGA